MTTQNKTGISFKTNGDFAIHVTDLQKAEEFYSKILGFKLVDKNADQLVYHTGIVFLYINKDSKTIPFIPALEVADFKKTKDYLMENGCKIIKESEGHNSLYFTDPFGFTIDIIQNK